MENKLHHNNAKMFRLTGLHFAQIANDEKSSLTPKETAKKLFEIFEDVVTVNEEKAEEFLNISDPKMKNSLLSLLDAISKFENQCLNHVNRLNKQKF